MQRSLTSLGRLGLDRLRVRWPLLGGTGVLPSSRSTRPSSRAWKASSVSDFLWAHTVDPAATLLCLEAKPLQTLLHLSLTPQTSPGPRHCMCCSISLSPPTTSALISCCLIHVFFTLFLRLPSIFTSHPLAQDTFPFPLYVPSCPVLPVLELLLLLQLKPKQLPGTSWHHLSFLKWLLQ